MPTTKRVRIAALTSIVLLAVLQVLSWTTIRDDLLKEALSALAVKADSGAAFDCTILSDDLTKALGPSYIREFRNKSAQRGISVREHQTGACSELHMAVKVNSPLVGVVEIHQYHPSYDSNGFRGYFLPAVHSWKIMGVRQSWH